jgi:hypothetical protein
MYKYFSFKRLFEADENMDQTQGQGTVTTAEPATSLVDLSELIKNSKLNLMLRAQDINTLTEQGYLQMMAEWKQNNDNTKIVTMQVLLFNPDSGRARPEVSSGTLQLTLTDALIDRIKTGIEGGHTVEETLDTPNTEAAGQPVHTSITREIDVTNVKGGEISVPAAEILPKPVEGTIDLPPSEGSSMPAAEPMPESKLMKFGEFVYESKKKEAWIGKIDMKEGALKKSMGKKEITSKDIAAELKKLEGKDKDKSKKGLQLGKKDATKQKRLVLAKNLMKASGADKKSKKK